MRAREALRLLLCLAVLPLPAVGAPERALPELPSLPSPAMAAAPAGLAAAAAPIPVAPASLAPEPASLSAQQALVALQAAAAPPSGQPASPRFASAVMDGAAAPKDAGESDVPEQASAPSSPQPKLYLFSRTLDTTVSLGPVARTFHYAREAVWQGAKVALAYRVGGAAAAALWWAAYELPTGLLTIAGMSLAHLNFLYWLKKHALVKRLSARPGVESLRVISGSSVEFKAFLAVTQRSRALVLAQARQAGPADPALGEPLEVDPARARLRVRFDFSGVSPLEWAPSLGQILAREPIPKDVAQAWRAHVNSTLSRESWLGRWFGSVQFRRARLPATLELPSGEKRDLGDIALGPAALKLFGGTRWARLKARLSWTTPAKPLPLSETRVRRP